MADTIPVSSASRPTPAVSSRSSFSISTGSRRRCVSEVWPTPKSSSPRDRLLESLRKQPPVGQFGELLVVREPAELAFGALSGGSNSHVCAPRSNRISAPATVASSTLTCSCSRVDIGEPMPVGVQDNDLDGEQEEQPSARVAPPTSVGQDESQPPGREQGGPDVLQISPHFPAGATCRGELQPVRNAPGRGRQPSAAESAQPRPRLSLGVTHRREFWTAGDSGCWPSVPQRRGRMAIRDPCLVRRVAGVPSSSAESATTVSTPGSPPAPAEQPAWWRDAVFYEIYLRSFADGGPRL